MASQAGKSKNRQHTKSGGSGTGGASRRGSSRRRTAAQSNLLVLRLLILVVAVLVVFEGKLIHTMFTQRSGDRTITASSADSAQRSAARETETEGSAANAAGGDDSAAAASDGAGALGGVAGLAGLSTLDSAGSVSTTSSDADAENPQISEVINSPAVVLEQPEAVDDSFFRDAVFIGDSRMEGFRNTSGITQGEFLTSVGMSLSGIGDTKVNTSDGQITVYQGLSGRKYGKIYLMLGTNDLGYYPWEAFQGHAEEVLEQFHKLQENADIYVCSVIYVEGQKISTDYVNNDNVRKVNGYLLSACEDLSFCHYLNLNEIFSNGYGALIDGATADGVHLQPQYSSMMLNYLKTHYIPRSEITEEATEGEA